MSETPSQPNPNLAPDPNTVQVSDQLWNATREYILSIPGVSAEFLRSELAGKMIIKGASDSERDALINELRQDGAAESIIKGMQSRGEIKLEPSENGGEGYKVTPPEKETEKPSRLARAGKIAGGMTVYMAFGPPTARSQTKAFLGHNDLSQFALKRRRQAKQDKITDGQKANKQQAQALLADKEAKKREEAAQQVLERSIAQADVQARREEEARSNKERETSRQQREDDNLTRQERLMDRQEALAKQREMDAEPPADTETQSRQDADFKLRQQQLDEQARSLAERELRIQQAEQAINDARRMAETSSESSEPTDIVDADVVEDSEAIHISEQENARDPEETEQERFNRIARDVVRENEDTVSPIDIVYERVSARYNAQDQEQTEPQLSPEEIKARSALPPRRTRGTSSLSERLKAAREAADASEASEVLDDPEVIQEITNRFNEAIQSYREFIANNPDADERTQHLTWQALTSSAAEIYGDTAYKSALRVTFKRLLNEEINRAESSR